MNPFEPPALLSAALVEARGLTLAPNLDELLRAAGIVSVRSAHITGGLGMLTLYKGKLTAHVSSVLDPEARMDALATLTVVAGSGRLQAEDPEETAIWMLAEANAGNSETDHFWEAAMWLLLPPKALVASVAAEARAHHLPLYVLERSFEQLLEGRGYLYTNLERLVSHLDDTVPEADPQDAASPEADSAEQAVLNAADAAGPGPSESAGVPVPANDLGEPEHAVSDPEGAADLGEAAAEAGAEAPAKSLQDPEQGAQAGDEDSDAAAAPAPTQRSKRSRS